MFARDIDLIVIAPTLFRDVVWPSQTLLRTQGAVEESVLSPMDKDVDFERLGVDSGHVVMLGETATEVVKRVDERRLLLSRPRAEGGEVIEVGKYKGAVRIGTFAPQIEVVHRRLLRWAEIEEAGRVTDPRAGAYAEALGALALIHFADEPAPSARGVQYQRRFEIECERLVLRLDMNGDGVAEQARRVSGGPMHRA
ncbi:MAG: hypothetical protein WCK33_11675 [Phycisphaerae bacterium]|jgi:hypothetical protein